MKPTCLNQKELAKRLTISHRALERWRWAGEGHPEQTCFRRREQNGGMGTDRLKELKRLQKENERLRKAIIPAAQRPIMHQQST